MGAWFPIQQHCQNPGSDLQVSTQGIGLGVSSHWTCSAQWPDRKRAIVQQVGPCWVCRGACHEAQALEQSHKHMVTGKGMHWRDTCCSPWQSHDSSALARECLPPHWANTNNDMEEGMGEIHGPLPAVHWSCHLWDHFWYLVAYYSQEITFCQILWLICQGFHLAKCCKSTSNSWGDSWIQQCGWEVARNQYGLWRWEERIEGIWRHGFQTFAHCLLQLFQQPCLRPCCRWRGRGRRWQGEWGDRWGWEHGQEESGRCCQEQCWSFGQAGRCKGQLLAQAGGAHSSKPCWADSRAGVRAEAERMLGSNCAQQHTWHPRFRIRGNSAWPKAEWWAHHSSTCPNMSFQPKKDQQTTCSCFAITCWCCRWPRYWHVANAWRRSFDVSGWWKGWSPDTHASFEQGIGRQTQQKACDCMLQWNICHGSQDESEGHCYSWTKWGISALDQWPIPSSWKEERAVPRKQPWQHHCLGETTKMGTVLAPAIWRQKGLVWQGACASGRHFDWGRWGWGRRRGWRVCHGPHGHWCKWEFVYPKAAKPRQPWTSCVPQHASDVLQGNLCLVPLQGRVWPCCRR